MTTYNGKRIYTGPPHSVDTLWGPQGCECDDCDLYRLWEPVAEQMDEDIAELEAQADRAASAADAAYDRGRDEGWA